MPVNSKLYSAVLGFCIIVGVLAVIGMLTIYQVPVENQRILDMCVGSLVVSFSTVIGYFFGSSAGSAAKNDLLSANNKKPPE